jgi:hypothetical protein
VALANLDGFFAVVRRLDREAAARAAVFRFEAFVLGVARLLDTRDFADDFRRAGRFAVLVDLRFATFPPSKKRAANGAARNRS